MPRMDNKNENAPSKREIESVHGLNPVDAFVGSRVKSRRINAGMSEEELGTLIGVPVVRMQAYERGERRLGARLLYEISIALECLPTVFFEDM
jgi:DNA-binding transcriptional regulator YiaG